MAQIQDGVCSVTFGSNAVAAAAGVDWSDVVVQLGAGVPVLFSVSGDTEVPYQVTSATFGAPVASVWNMTLASTYQGNTVAISPGAAYIIHTDFTNYEHLPLPAPGDTQMAQIISRAFETIDTEAANRAGTTLDYCNSSIISVSAAYATDTYLAGSSIVIGAGAFKPEAQYHCVFDMSKTAAGVATPIITVRIGTAGTTADTARLTFTFGAGTAVVDNGLFEVWVTWRSVGSGTSAIVIGWCKGVHNLATTGLFNNAATYLASNLSSGFNSSAATTIGLSFNGGTAFSGTNTLVQAQLTQ